MGKESGVKFMAARARRSGQQKGRENVQKAREYVSSKRQCGEPLPGNKDGNPNLSIIAFECEFDRGVFRDNPEARSVIEEAAKELGVTTEKRVAAGRVDHTEKQLERSNRRIQELEGKVAVISAERDVLRREKRELEEKIRQLTIFEEVMTTNGRRFIP